MADLTNVRTGKKWYDEQNFHLQEDSEEFSNQLKFFVALDFCISFFNVKKKVGFLCSHVVENVEILLRWENGIAHDVKM